MLRVGFFGSSHLHRSCTRPPKVLEFSKEKQLVGYLFDQLDDNTIISKQGMYEYLKNLNMREQQDA